MALTDAPNVPLLFIIGGDGADRVVNTGAKLRVTGSSDLSKLLLDREPYHRLHVTRNLFRQGRVPDLDGYRCLLNLITEPEQNARTLENLRRLLRDVPGKVVNRPEAVLRSTRDQVARQLDGIDGLIVPPTIRLPRGKDDVVLRALERAGMRPPVILRQAGTHGGRILGCFDEFEQLLAARDDARGEFVATQFVDFAGADGLYRKYRVFFIGPRAMLRHMLISDHWNVHAKDRTRYMAPRPECIAEERALFEGDVEPFPAPVRKLLEAVRERIPLDFFGMDFGITREGRVVLFEANATMSFFPFAPEPEFAYLQRCFAPAQAAFRELLGLPPQVEPMARVRLETA